MKTTDPNTLFCETERALKLALDVIEHQIDKWHTLPRPQQEAIKKHICASAGRIARLVNGLDKGPIKPTA